MISYYECMDDGYVLTCDDVKFKIPFEYKTSSGVHLMTVSKELMEFLKDKYNKPCLCWDYNSSGERFLTIKRVEI